VWKNSREKSVMQRWLVQSAAAGGAGPSRRIGRL